MMPYVVVYSSTASFTRLHDETVACEVSGFRDLARGGWVAGCILTMAHESYMNHWGLAEWAFCNCCSGLTNY